MKKLMIVAATLAAGIAMADAIESDNTVGYIQSPVDSDGMCPIGVSLKNIGSNVFSVSNTLFGTTLSDDDQVYFLNMDNGDWDCYSYNSVDGWTAILSDGSMETGLATIPSIAKGEGCYYLPADWVTPLVLAGEVEASGSKDLVMSTQDGSDVAYQFVNPYPKDTTFADFESFLSPDDQVYVLNTSNGDWDVYAFNGTGDWTAILSDGTLQSINESEVPGYLSNVLLGNSRAAWVLPAWDFGASFPQARTFTSTYNY